MYCLGMAPSTPTAPAFVRLAGHPLRWQLLTALAHSDLRVRELVALIGQPQNLVSYHLRLLRAGGLVTAHRSSFDGRDSYYHLDLERCARALADTGTALHPALAAPEVDSERFAGSSVLFLCTGNSARSPIAEALLRRHTVGHAQVASAGSHPKSRLHPYAVGALRDHYGVDVAAQRPRHLDSFTGRRFDYVITLCDKVREVRPEFGGRSRPLHWSVADPAAGTGRPDYSAFAETAADIDARVRHLLPVLADTDPKEVEP
jgi:protein-tyrosine-phosphatase/DNA-binding transcriptional ArsR family regulator